MNVRPGRKVNSRLEVTTVMDRVAISTDMGQEPAAAVQRRASQLALVQLVDACGVDAVQTVLELVEHYGIETVKGLWFRNIALSMRRPL